MRKLLVVLAFVVFCGQVASTQDVAGALAKLQQAQQAIAAAQALLAGPPPSTTVPLVGAQQTIDAAPAGAVLQLQAGVVYPPLNLTGAGKTLQGGKVQHLDITNAVNWVLKGVEVTSEQTTRVEGVWCDPSSNHITFDGFIYHGVNPSQIRRAIAANCPAVTIVRALIDNLASPGLETQGISAWDNVGPITITDSNVSAGSENIFIGGGNVNPDNVYVARNVLTKPDSWRTQKLVVKNLFEVKSGTRIVFEDNTLSGCWPDGQGGSGIVLTIRNQDGPCITCTIQHLIVRRNNMTKVAAGFNLLGLDNVNASIRGDDWLIDNNTVGLGPGNAGRAFLIGDAPTNLKITNNKFTLGGTTNAFLAFYGLKLSGFIFTGNDVYQGDYGITGDGTTIGKVTVDFYNPSGYTWSGNTVHNGSGITPGEFRVIPYPAGTTLVP